MQIIIQGTDVPAADPLAEHARRRLRFGLTRHGETVRSVKVRMTRLRIDALACRITVDLVDCAPVQVAESGPDAASVIERAADRASRIVVSHLERARGPARGVHWSRTGATPPPVTLAQSPAVPAQVPLSG